MSPEQTLLRWLERLETRAWRLSPDQSGTPAAFWRCVLIVLRGAITDRAFERAGYLTYFSLLYMVPLVALMLALAETLGWGKSALEFVVARIAVTAPELAEGLHSAIQQVDFVAIGLAALAGIIVAGFLALISLEGIIDDIWVAHERRPVWKTLALYPLLIFGAPTAAALVLAISAAAESQAEALMIVLPQATRFGELLYDRLYELTFLLQWAPFLLICAVLTLVYFLVPSGRVRWQAALVGGIAAGIGWQIAQSFYINIQFATGSFRLVWGLLAQIPLLLLWMYASWLVVLAGVELSFAWQHRYTYLPKSPTDNLSPHAHEHAMLEVCRLLVELGETHPAGLTSAEISCRLRLPWSLVRRHLASLTAIGAVHSVPMKDSSTYFAAGDLTGWTIGKLLDTWRNSGDSLPEAKRHEHHWPDNMKIGETISPPTS